MTYKAAKRKLFLEKIFMLPFVWAGMLAGKLVKCPHQTNLFLFYPNGDIGGSPQVNIDLANCLKDKLPMIIFSKNPRNALFREKYNIPGVFVYDIHGYIDNKAFHFINFFFRGLLSEWINKQKTPVVFGGESLFFYKMLPHLKRHVHSVELCHLDTWLNYSIGFSDMIGKRVFSTEKLKDKVAQQYLQNGLPESFFKKLKFIENAIDIPPFHTNQNTILQVVFIGRGAPQKRVHLTAAIAKKCFDKNIPVKFTFVGDVENVISPDDHPYCDFPGNIHDQEQMNNIYSNSDVLILTSSFEGLPVVVMQMMAHGKTVISTAVNAIPDYIVHNENGLLIKATNESDIVEEGVSYIEQLVNNKDLLQKFGMKSREMAIQKFSKQDFCREYREILKVD